MAEYFGPWLPSAYFGGGYWRQTEASPFADMAATITGAGTLTGTLETGDAFADMAAVISGSATVTATALVPEALERRGGGGGREAAWRRRLARDREEWLRKRRELLEAIPEELVDVQQFDVLLPTTPPVEVIRAKRVALWNEIRMLQARIAEAEREMDDEDAAIMLLVA